MIGVSRNGRKWQAIIKDGTSKRYLGLFVDIADAGRAFDREAMLLRGTRARTNFSYTKRDIRRLFAKELGTIGINF